MENTKEFSEKKQCDTHLVSSSKRFGAKIKFHYISPKTSERHIKEFELMADAYYWGMKNLDIKLDWQIVEL